MKTTEILEIKTIVAEAFMDVAFRFSLLSKCLRLKVGCVCVKNGAIIGIGWNGLPPGIVEDSCENEEGFTKDSCNHAEDNMLIKLSGSTESARDSVVFLTHSPCTKCAPKLAMAGVRKVYYRHQYRTDEGVKYLQNNGVEVEQI